MTGRPPGRPIEKVRKNLIDRVFSAPTEAAWLVHGEVAIDATPSDAAFRRAARATVVEHPMLAAREGQDGAVWHLGGPVEDIDVRIFDGDPGDPDERVIRDRLVSEPVRLEAGPVARFALIRRPGEPGIVIAVAHHALIDGVGIRCVLASLVRHLLEPGHVHEDERWRAAHAVSARRVTDDKRSEVLSDLRRHVAGAPVRLAGSRGRRGPSSEVRCRTIERDGDGARPSDEAQGSGPGEVMTDRVLAAFAKMVMAWNVERGAPAIPVGLVVPVNLRPARWWLDGACNATITWPVQIRTDRPAEREAEVRDQLAPVRSGIYSPAIAALLDQLAGGPASAWLQQALAGTILVSVIPAVEGPADAAVAAVMASFWGTAPPVPSAGVSFSAAITRSTITLGVRFDGERFTQDEAGRMLDHVAALLDPVRGSGSA